jgi:hypothetical protein
MKSAQYETAETYGFADSIMRKAPPPSSTRAIPPFAASACRPDEFQYMDDSSIEFITKI